MNLNFVESERLLENVLGFLTILCRILPDEVFGLRIYENDGDLLRGDVVLVEDLGRLDCVACRICEVRVTVHCLEHEWELDRERLVVQASDESLEE